MTMADVTLAEPGGDRDNRPSTFENHPIAEMFPLLEGKPLDELTADIKARGLLEPIVLFEGKILDGRNRYQACLRAGVPLMTQEFGGDDPVSFVASMNLHRRHLTQKQKRAVTEEFVKREPHKTDRAIAKAVQVDHKTVGAVRRAGLEANGEIPHNDEHPAVIEQIDPDPDTNVQIGYKDKSVRGSVITPEESAAPKPKASPAIVRVEASGRKARGRQPASAPAAKPTRAKASGIGTPREQWIVASTAVYKKPASELHANLVDTIRCITGAPHLAEIPEPKRQELVRQFAAALQVQVQVAPTVAAK
jgi:hypothetical protein